MGVDVELFAIIGLNRPYGEVKIYQSKADEDYIWDLENDYLKEYKHVLFKDYLPDNYKAVNDSMGGEYCIFGQLIGRNNDLYNGFELSLSTQDIEKITLEVSKNLKALGIEHDIKDIKLHIFTHFS